MASARPLVAELPDGVREVKLAHAECCDAVSQETEKIKRGLVELNRRRDKLLERARELELLATHDECWLDTCEHCRKAVA